VITLDPETARITAVLYAVPSVTHNPRLAQIRMIGAARRGSLTPMSMHSAPAGAYCPDHAARI